MFLESGDAEWREMVVEWNLGRTGRLPPRLGWAARSHHAWQHLAFGSCPRLPSVCTALVLTSLFDSPHFGPGNCQTAWRAM